MFLVCFIDWSHIVNALGTIGMARSTLEAVEVRPSSPA